MPFIRGLDTALREADLELWFVDGNHEAFPMLMRYPVLVQVHGLHCDGWYLEENMVVVGADELRVDR